MLLPEVEAVMVDTGASLPVPQTLVRQGVPEPAVPAPDLVLAPSLAEPGPVASQSWPEQKHVEPAAQVSVPVEHVMSDSQTFALDAPADSASSAMAVSQAPAPVSPELSQVAPEPFRTGRWEAARTVSRPETAPWRDRRVSGPNAVYRAPERRFNWNTAAAKPISLVPNTPAQAGGQPSGQVPIRVNDQQVQAPVVAPERLAVTSQDASGQPGRLTRKWGLLSRFDHPQDSAETGRETERNAEPQSGQRSYRRG